MEYCYLHGKNYKLADSVDDYARYTDTKIMTDLNRGIATLSVFHEFPGPARARYRTHGRWNAEMAVC